MYEYQEMFSMVKLATRMHANPFPFRSRFVFNFKGGIKRDLAGFSCLQFLIRIHKYIYIVYIIYICININVNLENMDKTKVITKRKIINLRPETEKNLRLIAVNYGQNLKSYIESVLEELANEDEMLIALSKAPGTDDILNQSEKAEFLKSISA